jgi:hypothetical protein
MSEQHESFTKFVEVNGTWLLSFVAMLSACVSGTLVYFLKSRCLKIKCGCIECIREPISEDNLNNVDLRSNNV